MIEPAATIEPAQLIEHFGKDRREVRDVTNCIINLALIQRSPRPIGETRTLIKRDAKPAINEIGITNLFALTKCHRRNLRVKQRMRGFSSQIVNDFNILAARVEDFEDIFIVSHQIEQWL